MRKQDGRSSICVYVGGWGWGGGGGAHAHLPWHSWTSGRSASFPLSPECPLSVPSALLRSKIFGKAGGIVDMLVRNVPSSRAATAAKVERCYTGGLTAPVALSCSYEVCV